MRRASPAARTIAAITVSAGAGWSPRPPSEDLRLRALDRGLDRALREHAAEMRLVFHGALQVGLHVDAVGALRRRGFDRGRVQLLAGERRLDALRAHRVRARSGDADARLRALAVLVERDHRRHADDGKA